MASIDAKPIIVYATSFPVMYTHEFYNVDTVPDFIASRQLFLPIEPMAFSPGLPQFRLGTRVQIRLNGEFFKSDIKYGPKFLFASGVQPGARMTATIPVYDNFVSPDGLIHCSYKNQYINPHEFAAIIEPRTLRQLWPTNYGREKHSVLNSFLSNAMRTQNIKLK